MLGKFLWVYSFNIFINEYFGLKIVALLEIPKTQPTVKYTLRLNHEVFREIQKEAAENGVPISNVMSQILTRYVRRDRYFEQLGFVPISKDILRKLLRRVNEKFLIEDSKQLGAIIAPEYVAYFFQEVNKHTLLEFLNLWFSRFHSYRHRFEGDLHSFCVYHDISVEFSTCMKGFLQGLIEPVISKQVNFTKLTSNLISFSFEI